MSEEKQRGAKAELERLIKLLYLQKLDKAKELIALINGKEKRNK